jgi:hypothetical protein
VKGFLLSLGWSRWQQLLFLFFLSLFVVVLTFGLCKGMTVTDWILWVTGVVLLVYTVETNGLRYEMIRQNELTIQPVIVATVVERLSGTVQTTPTFERKIILRNVGRGTALFIKIRDLTLTDPLPDRVRFVAKFAPISFLEPEQQEVVEIAECSAIDTEVPSENFDPATSLFPRYAVEDYHVVIEYQDTNGANRDTLMQIGNGGIRLLPRDS